MDLKALIAKMDQIESKKILTEAEDRPAAKKTDTTWTDKSGKKHPATRVQGSKSVAADKEADKERKKNDKDLEEMTLKSAIAQELLKEFNVSDEPIDEFVDKIANWHKQNAANYRARQASGELPPDGWNTEVNGPWMGKTQQVPVTSSDGKPVQAGSGGNVVSNVPVSNPPTAGKPPAGAPTAGKPPAATPAPVAQDDATGVDAAVAAQQAASGPTDAEIAANNAALGNWTDQPDTTGGTSGKPPAQPQGAKVDPDQADIDDAELGKAMAANAAAAAGPDTLNKPSGGVNPTVLNRYKELLDKLEGAGKKPAAATAKPPAKPPTSGKPPAAKPNDPATITGEPNQAVGGGTINSLGAGAEQQQESIAKLRDDQILALIRGM